MTRHPHLDPQDEALLLDGLQGELTPAAQAALAARLAREPALAAAHASWAALLRAEHEAFEPAAQRAAAEADAGRLAAWIRSEAGRGEAVRVERVRRARWAPSGSRGWARILAWSVGVHVLVLGALFLSRSGEAPRGGGGATAHVQLDDLDAWAPPLADAADRARAIRYEHISWDDVATVSDRLVTAEPETFDDELRDDFERAGGDQPIAWDGLNHPASVVFAMARRKKIELKRRRLDLLGFNAQGTLTAVDRGLRFLGNRQAPDGAFPAGGDRSALRQTAVSLLAFLGDGHTSRGRKARDAVVRRGIAWLRGQVFRSDGPRVEAVAAPSADLGPATVALCEDYMLSFGDLPPKAAARRSDEIAALATLARERLDGASGTERTWNVWALDAATRAGVVTPSAEDQRVFAAWVSDAAGDESVGEDVMQALRVGTALMFAERGADKPRFLAWSRTHAAALAARLDPTGRARSGDPIGETAMVLLALQVAYRTY